MADLYNLLGELDNEDHDTYDSDNNSNYDSDNNNDDDHNSMDSDNGNNDNAEPKQGRPSLAATEATEPMTGDDWESPIRAEIPAALQEASEKYRLAHDLNDDYNTDDYDHDNNNNNALEDVQHLEDYFT